MENLEIMCEHLILNKAFAKVNIVHKIHFRKYWLRPGKENHHVDFLSRVTHAGLWWKTYRLVRWKVWWRSAKHPTHRTSLLSVSYSTTVRKEVSLFPSVPTSVIYFLHCIQMDVPYIYVTVVMFKHCFLVYSVCM